MRKKNHFTSATISFEEFEASLASNATNDLTAEELIEYNDSAERSAKQREVELKKKHQVRKRKR